MKRLAILIAAGALLSGCGLRPVYGGAARGPVAAVLAGVAVSEIPGRPGWLVRTALQDRLTGVGRGAEAPASRYRLEIELDDQITGFGVRFDNAVTRERRTLRARYRLVEAAQGTVLLDASAAADAGIDVVSSEYATIAAEDSALERLSADIADQIVARLATYARAGGATPVATSPATP